MNRWYPAPGRMARCYRSRCGTRSSDHPLNRLLSFLTHPASASAPPPEFLICNLRADPGSTGNLPSAIEGNHTPEWWRGREACPGREHQRSENRDNFKLVTLHRSILSHSGLHSDQGLAWASTSRALARIRRTAYLFRAGIEYAVTGFHRRRGNWLCFVEAVSGSDSP